MQTRVLMVASECMPFIKTGGLADVVGALPISLRREGMEARVILPKYKQISPQFTSMMEHVMDFEIPLGWRRQYVGVERVMWQGVTYYFIDNEYYFSKDWVYGYGDYEAERFAFFSRAVAEAICRMDYRPDIVHCHDWQSGMVPFLLKTQYGWEEFVHKIRFVYTIHNLQYQGIFRRGEMQDFMHIDDQYVTADKLEFYGSMSFAKAGLVYADAITTVSPTYAREIQQPPQGEMLDGLLRARSHDLHGILNGIDTDLYNPATDATIYAQFSHEDISGKAVNKLRLQQDLHIEERPEVPLIGMITRLTAQKGLDLVERVLDEILRLDVQLVILGRGDSHYADLFRDAQNRYPGKCAARIDLDTVLANRIYAGGDMFLMPSLFEPCGLSQLLAMRYGSVPIVRETGGLIDTIKSYNEYDDSGNGFSFTNYNAHDMLYTIERAVGLYYSNKPVWQRLMLRGMQQDFGWSASAREYVKLYQRLLGNDA